MAADTFSLGEEICSLKTRIKASKPENHKLLEEVIMLQQNLQDIVDKREEKRLSADFILNISVQSTSLQLGNNIAITATFQNQSTAPIELSHSSSWIMPSIANWATPDDIRLTIIDLDEVITVKWQIGDHLEKGRHLLVALATFTRIQRVDGNIVSSQSFIIESNKLVLTFTE